MAHVSFQLSKNSNWGSALQQLNPTNMTQKEGILSPKQEDVSFLKNLVMPTFYPSIDFGPNLNDNFNPIGPIGPISPIDPISPVGPINTNMPSFFCIPPQKVSIHTFVATGNNNSNDCNITYFKCTTCNKEDKILCTRNPDPNTNASAPWLYTEFLTWIGCKQ